MSTTCFSTDRRIDNAGKRGGRYMRRPRGACVVASRDLELEVTIRGSGTPAASALARHCEATRVSHDALGRPVSTADSESAARTWTYNERSEMTGCSSNDGSYSYFYDSIGNGYLFAPCSVNSSNQIFDPLIL